MPAWSDLRLVTNWDLLDAAKLYKNIANACNEDKAAITIWTKQ